MSGEPSVTIVGNATADGELRFLPSGAALCKWTLAVTPRVKEGDEWRDGATVWYSCTAWRQLGESAAESITRGMRLLVHGRLRVRTFEDKQGATRTSLEVEVEHVGAEMRYANVTAVKANRSSSSAAGRSGTGGEPAADDPWGSAPAASSQSDQDEPPF